MSNFIDFYFLICCGSIYKDIIGEEIVGLPLDVADGGGATKNLEPSEPYFCQMLL
jgi:hypothetical protein